MFSTKAAGAAKPQAAAPLTAGAIIKAWSPFIILTAHGGEPQTDRGRVAARVDDDRLGRAERGPDDGGVRPDGAELELFDGEFHEWASLARAAAVPRTHRHRRRSAPIEARISGVRTRSGAM